MTRATPPPPPPTCGLCHAEQVDPPMQRLLGGLLICDACDREIQRRPGRKIGQDIRDGLRKMAKDRPCPT
jgi:hypothetical protein